jgi:two-component system NtrC family sensor kinase
MRLRVVFSSHSETEMVAAWARAAGHEVVDGEVGSSPPAVSISDASTPWPDAGFRIVVAPEPLPGFDDHLPAPLTEAALRQRLALAERLLRAERHTASHASLRVALDLSCEMMFRVDARGRIQDVNAAACRRLGYDRDTLLSMSIQDVSPNHDPARWPVRWARVAAEGSMTLQSFQRDAAGEIFPVEATLAFVDGGGSGDDAIVSFVRDLTEKKRTEASLLLADRLHALGLMAAATAHELNTPLAYLTGSLGFIEAELTRESGEPDRPALLTAVGDAVDGARRVNRIVRNLRAFARAESGENDATPEAIRVQEVLETAIRLTGRFIDANALLAPFRPPPGPELWVHADAPRLVQVVVNLLVNALQAMPQRSRVENVIELRLERRGDDVAICVADNGEGISSAVRARIFDPFFTTKPAGVGTGLGLSVCHGIVSGLGGRIEVESEPGRGACFTVLLPAAPASPRVTLTPGVLPVLRRRVLVVDDEVQQLRAFQRLFGRTALITTCTTAEEAIEQLRTGAAFDLVLCDVNMPGRPGTQVHAFVAAERPELLPGFYLTSGGIFTSETQRYVDEHAPRMLDKPMDSGALLALLEARSTAETRAP